MPRVRLLVLGGHMVVVYGLELALFGMLKAARERGHEVHCILNDWENEPLVQLCDAVGATWSTASYAYAINKAAFGYRRVLRTMRQLARTNWQLLREVARFRPTHVIAPDFAIILRNAPALLCLRLIGVPVIFSVPNSPTSTRWYRKLWRWVVNPLVSQFVANSRFTASRLRAVGVPGNKVRAVIYPSPLKRRGTSTADGHSTTTPRVVYVGQVIPSKGLHLLLEAVEHLIREGRDLQLDVVGQVDGWESPTYAGYRERIIRQASTGCLAGRVHFHGYVDDVSSILSRATIHCCPSPPEQEEAFGMVNVEAKEAGLPTVAFDGGAIPELVEHEVTGWICRDTSARALAEGLACFLDDPGARVRASAAARASAASFSSARSDHQWLQVLEAR